MPLRARAGAASLKLDDLAEGANDYAATPRPRGRGLVEAVFEPPRRQAHGLTPRPRGRGLVEAREGRWICAGQLTTPRPRGRGLVEARQRIFFA